MTVRHPLVSLTVVTSVFLSLGLPTCNGVRLPTTRLVSNPWESASNRGIHIPSGGTPGGLDATHSNSTASPGNKTNVILRYVEGIQDWGVVAKDRWLRVWRKANQCMAGIPAKLFIGARSALGDYHLAAEWRNSLAVNLVICFGLQPALNHPRMGRNVQLKLSKALLNTYKYSQRALIVVQIVSLAAWGFKVQDRIDKGIEAFFLPTILSVAYRKAYIFFMRRATPYWQRAILGPLWEEVSFRMLLSSIGIRTTMSNSKRVVIMEATKASTNKASLGSSWITDLLFGVIHIGNYIPIVDHTQAADDAFRLTMGLSNRTWDVGRFQNVYELLIVTRSQMNDEQIVEASKLSSIAFLVSRRVFGPVFEKHGVWASIGAHSMRNAIGSSGVKFIGPLQCLYGVWTGELPLKDSVAAGCIVLGSFLLHFATGMKYLYKYEGAV